MAYIHGERVWASRMDCVHPLQSMCCFLPEVCNFVMQAVMLGGFTQLCPFLQYSYGCRISPVKGMIGAINTRDGSGSWRTQVLCIDFVLQSTTEYS